MKNLKQIDHFTGTAGKQQSLKAGVVLLLMGVMLTLLPAALQAQVLQPFAQRTSDYSPDMPIYHIKGDYTMIGNTSVTFNAVGLNDECDNSYNNSNSNDNPNNYRTMKYVDVDESTFPTINSSTAALTFSDEFGANPACSEVVYAGLYWIGRTNRSYVSRTTTTTTENIYSGETGGGYTLTITQNDNDRIFTFTKPGSDPIVLTMRKVEVEVQGRWSQWTRYSYYVYNGAETEIYDNVPRSENANNDPNLHPASLDDPVQLPGTNYTITQLYWNSTLSECYATIEVLHTTTAINPWTNDGSQYYLNKIKIKHANESTYTEVTASPTNVYGGTSASSNIYTAYAEVTDYVRRNGLGNYTVADLVTNVGQNDNAGWIGCWGMVVVYENSKMKWRDITLFDGFANVESGNNVTIPISGFKAVQVGDVHVKLGMMAAEGDRGINGDKCGILRQADGAWQYLYHAGHTTQSASNNNFFNSSIETGGNYCYPNYVNNTGIDIVMFNIPNENNEVLDNEQTNTSFRFTSTGDLYFPVLFVMGVDAYIPDAEALSGVMNIDDDDITIDSETGNYLIEPGKEITFEVEVKNFGTEDIVNAKLEIPLPSTIVYYRAEVDYVYPGINIEGYFDAERYANGVAGWNIDYIPSGDPNQVYARVLLTVKVTDDCFVLASTDPECELAIEVNGTLEGISYVNGVYFKKESFISGFADETGCQGNAVRNNIKVVVNKENYVNNNCQGRDYTVRLVNVCGNAFNATNPIPFMDIYALYPQGSRFFNAATGVEYTAATGFPISLAGNDASSAALIHVQPTSIYSAACTSDLRFILDPDGNSFTTPTLTNSATYCLDAQANPLLSHITSTIPDDVYFRFYKENSNSAVAYVDIVPPTDVEGTYTYYVRQFRENAIGCEDETFYGPITIEVVSPITITSSEASPSCVGRPVTITGVPAGGTWSWADTLTGITVSGNVLTIAGNIAGTYTVTYTHNNPGTAGYSCTNTARSYTHQIAATTNAGRLNADQTICQGAQIQPLQIVGHNGHVERWEWTTDLSSTQWDIIPNNTSSISTADLGELAVGTYYFKALVKDGNCAAVWTNTVTITVTNNSAPNPPTVTSPQYVCIGTPYTIEPSGSNYQWYEQEIGGWPIGGNTPVHSVTVTVTDEWITRYVSVVDAGTHCVSNRAEVQVRPNLEPGQINNVGQRECDLNEEATTIGSYYDAEAYGGGTVEYQWYVQANGGEEQLISGATSATFTPSAYMGTEGEYIFIRKVRNSTCANWQQSRGSWRLVVGKPDASIEAVPRHATICQNGGVELRLRVPSSTAYSYQWYKDGIAIPNATGHEYRATEVGRYTAQVTHRASGCSATTREADTIKVEYDDAAPTTSSPTTTLDGCSIDDARAVTAYNNVIDANASGLGFNISDVITPADLLTLTHTETQTENPTGACYQLVRTYTVTDQCGFSTTFTHTINVVDTEVPVIATTAVSGDKGCNPTIVAPIFTGTDNCAGDISSNITVTEGEVIEDGCKRTQTWTANYTDACGNVATPVSITYTWTVDTEKPLISTSAVSGDKGCNPTIVAPIFTGTDNCAGDISASISVVTNGPSHTGCAYTQTWTANYTDACNNAADEVSVTYTWTEDEVAPTIGNDNLNRPLTSTNCNFTLPDFTSEVRAISSDNCTAREALVITQNVAAGTTYTPSITPQTVTVTVTVKDACGNTSTKDIDVTIPTALTASATATHVLCNGGDGSVALTVSGGTTPYRYAWSNGATTEDLSSVSAGTYTVTVTDENGCTATASATVSQPAALSVSLTTGKETCAGNDGKINYTIAGGTANYTVVLSGGSATQTAIQTATGTNTFTGLEDGTYTVTVTDGNNCVATATETIAFNNNFTVSASNTAICSGATFTVDPTASHPAKYSWAAPTATGINGAAAGTDASNISGTLTNTTTSATDITYTVTATTANGLCTVTPFNVVVTVYAPVTGGSIQKNFIVCNGLDSVVTLTNEVSGNGGVNGGYIWQSVSNGTTTTIEGANGETYTPESVVGTVQYQRVYTTGCGNQPSNVVSVTYYGNVSPGRVVCSNGCAENYCYGSNINVTLRTSDITIQSGASYSIQWQQSTDNGATWTNISGATSDTYTYTNSNFTSPIQFRYTITVTGCAAVPSNSVHSIGVWALPVVSIAEVATLCPSAASTDIKGTIETTTTPNYTYHWSAGSGLTLPNLPDPNLPEPATSATSNTITGTFLTTDCNATYSASLYVVDGNGCQSNTATETFTVVDKTAPTFTRPADITIYTNANCTYDASVSVTGDVTDEADNCSTNLNATYSDAIADGTCEGTKVITRTWSLVDACGNAAANQVQTITVLDTTAPTITCSDNFTRNTDDGQPYATVTLPNPTYDDNCSATYSISYSPATPTNATATNASGQYPLGVTTVTYSVVDGCDNANSCSFTVTVGDDEHPEITCPPSKTVACETDTLPVLTTYAAFVAAGGEATDNDGINELSFRLSGYSKVGTCPTTITRTYYIEDITGNSETCEQVITIKDSIAPVLVGTWPTNITGQDNCFANAVISGLYTDDQVKALYSDCSGITVTHSDANTLTSDCGWTVTRTYTIKDACNNTVTPAPTMSVSGSDQTAPALTGTWPSNITGQDNCFANADTAGLKDDSEIKALYSDCSGITVTHSDANTLTDDCGWTVTRTYTIKDACNNTVTPAPTMSVSGSDQTAPVLAGTWPTNITGQDNCFANADTAGLKDDSEIKALYEDCSGITVTHSDANTLTDDCGWTVTRTYTIKDACNNTVTPAPTMSVSGSDQTAPALKVADSWPDNITGQDNCFANAVTSGLYTDDQVKALYGDCSTITVTHSDANTLTENCGWTITRTYTIKDACNNTVTPAPTMSVSGSDQTAPALTGTWPDNITGQDNCFAAADISELLSDDAVKALYSDCSTITITHEDANTSTADCGWTVTRTYTITDLCGNTVMPKPTMSVSGSDQTVPALTGTWPTNITGQDNCFANADTAGLKDDSEIKALYEDCSGITVTHSDANTLTDDCGWTITRTYTIKDACNNSVTRTMSVSGRDQTAPALTGTWPANITGQDNCFDNRNIHGLYSNDQVKALYSDCSALTVTSSDAVTGNNCGWTVTRTYTITDACNNSVTNTMSVSGSDQTAPGITDPTLWPANITNQNNCFANADISGLYNDNQVKNLYKDCSTITVTHIDSNVSVNDCDWTIMRIYTVKDECGNTVMPKPTMSVSGSDQTAPYIMPTVLDRTLTATGCVFIIPDMREEVRAISSDGCTGNSELTVEQPSAGMQVYPQVIARDTNVIIRVTDACGNYSLKSVKITIPAKVVITATATPASICNGETAQLSTTVTNVVGAASYVWEPATGLNSTTIYNPTTTLTATGAPKTVTYTVQVTDANGCTATATTFVTVNPEVVINALADTVINSGTVVPAKFFTTPLTGGVMTYNWTRTNTDVVTGMDATGTGNVPGATLYNNTNTAKTTTITVTPTFTANGISCVGATVSYTITVNPKVVMDDVEDQAICHGSEIEPVAFGTTITDATSFVYNWVRTNTANVTGLTETGSGNIDATALYNETDQVQVTTFTVTPTYFNNGISSTGTPITFTITVNPKVVMNDVEDQAICHGSAIAAVNFTTPITDGSVVYNWRRTNSNVVGLAMSGTGNIPATVLTNTTNTAQVDTITVTPIYTNNGNTCTDESITFTITVNPKVVMNTVANQAICHGSEIAAVNFTTPITDGSVVYNWTRDNDNIEGLVMNGTGNIAAATLTNTTNTAQTTTITVTPLYANNGKTCTDESITFTITVNPKVRMNTVANQAICHGSAITAVNFTTPITDGSMVYNWTRDNDNIEGLEMSGTGNIAAATLTNTTNAAQTTTITVTPLYANNGKTCTDESITFTITVNPKVRMNTVANQAICHGSAITAVNFTTPITDGSVVYNWRRTNSNVVGLAMSGTGNIPATVLTNTTNTAQVDTITVTPVYTNNGNECTDESITFTITVNPKVVMDTVANQAICHNSAITAVNFTTPITDGSVVYNWSRDNDNISGLDMSGTGNIPATILTNTTNTAQTTTITVIPVYTNNGNECIDESITFTITVNPKVVMDTVANQAICHNSAIAAVNFTTPITDGSVVYNWRRTNSNVVGLAMSGTGNIPATVLTNTTNTAQVDTITVTPVYTNNGNECTDESITFTITVNPKVVMDTVANQAICHNSAITAVNFTTPITDGSVVYNWRRTNSNVVGLAMSGTGNIAAATLTNTTNTAQTTTITVIPVYTNNGNECTDESITFTITVNPKVVMNTVEDWTLCVGETSPEYVYTSTITDGTVTYGWSNDNSAIGLAASGTGNLPSFVAANAMPANLIAEVKVAPTYANNGISCQGDSLNFHITVRPSITTPGNVEFTCPRDTTVVLSYSECEQFVNIGYPEFVNHMSGMNVNITNDAPAGNIFPEGTTIVTWTATDECGAALTCTQSVVIQFPSCGDSIADFDGYRYSSVRIGCQCWTGENARSEHYSDGTPVDNFRYYNDSDSLENIYGKLYTWYTAVRVPEGDNNAEPSISTDPLGRTYVQGICPEGWALPTVDEYMLMIANSGDATHAKDGSNLYWLPGYEGQPPFSGFDAYGAGLYNGAHSRYEGLLGKTYFWTTLSSSGSETATTVEINYYCAEGLQTELSKGDGVSIRCIRKR